MSIGVMIVDDQTLFVDSLIAALDATDDLQVVGASRGGADAVDKVLQHRPDVILLDHRLPGQDGMRLLESLRNADPDARIILVSSVIDERAVIDAVELGCVGFMTKDRGLDDLTRSIRAVDAGDVMVSPDVLAAMLPHLRDGNGETGASPLTRREREILELVAEGRTNQSIAEALTLSLHTVRNHVQNILRKLDAHSKLEAVAIAGREGLLDRVR